MSYTIYLTNSDLAFSAQELLINLSKDLIAENESIMFDLKEKQRIEKEDGIDYPLDMLIEEKAMELVDSIKFPVKVDLVDNRLTVV